MTLVGLLLAQMDMHDAGAGVEGGLGLARHLPRRHGDMVLLRVGQHAVQRAGDDSLVAHDVRSGCGTSSGTRRRRVLHDGGLAAISTCVDWLFAHAASRSRRMFCASFIANVLPSKDQRAQGMPGAQCTRSLACELKKSTRA